NPSTGKIFTGDTCVGLSKRYQLCNDQPCPAGAGDNFRGEQCAAYNKVDFQGQQYSWEPYIKDDAECELNCKPMGMKYFATLNDTVIDGTPCQRPAEYYRTQSSAWSRAMCVDGICKAVLSNGSIKGFYANSGSVSCGGLLCRPVTGIFTRDPLPEEAYVHVANIPAGASNISITELKNSPNLLVLRTNEEKNVFNGDNVASESGLYEAVGASFDYHRIDGMQHGEGVTEWITSMGPIKEAIELLVYSNGLNPGIKYEYLLPIVSDSEENELSLESSDGFLKSGAVSDDGSSSSSTRLRRRKFNWKVVGFSPCTKSCGGGTQAPIVRCARENPVRYYSQRRCSHSEKPVLNENLLHCNTQPCPAYWRLDEWSECRCQHGEALRRRELSCVQELASGIVIHVDKAACMEEQPPSEKPCECPKTRRRNNSARYRMQDNRSGNGTHLQRYKTAKLAGEAVWLMSDWNQYCSAACGSGIEHRTIFCDRPKNKAERCEPRDTPDNRRPCERNACELGDWFAGPWAPCNGDCFNLTRSRHILCIKNQLITEDEECKAELKPQATESCSHEEVEYCAPRWHYSEWSECTKSCDGGTQRRSVKCLEYDERLNALRESNKCRYAIRESIYRPCNANKCADLINELQSDDANVCKDNFPNCRWAVQAKLCSYDYYRNNCCNSCT
ncbi:CG6232, partial [Drosophila busckii]